MLVFDEAFSFICGGWIDEFFFPSENPRSISSGGFFIAGIVFLQPSFDVFRYADIKLAILSALKYVEVMHLTKLGVDDRT